MVPTATSLSSNPGDPDASARARAFAPEPQRRALQVRVAARVQLLHWSAQVQLEALGQVLRQGLEGGFAVRGWWYVAKGKTKGAHHFCWERGFKWSHPLLEGLVIICGGIRRPTCVAAWMSGLQGRSYTFRLASPFLDSPPLHAFLPTSGQAGCLHQ